MGGTDLVTLTAREGEFTARFSVDPAHETWLKPGDMALGARLATWEGVRNIPDPIQEPIATRSRPLGGIDLLSTEEGVVLFISHLPS